MRRVEAELTDDPLPMAELAQRVYMHEDPSRAEVESVRRAAKRLAEQGRLEVDYIDPDESGLGLWSQVCAERGYEPDARPAHPVWQLAVRRNQR